MYTKVYRHGRSDRTCLCALRAKIPERGTPLRKSLRSILYQALRGRRVYIPQTPGSASSPEVCIQEKPTYHRQAFQE